MRKNVEGHGLLRQRRLVQRAVRVEVVPELPERVVVEQVDPGVEAVEALLFAGERASLPQYRADFSTGLASKCVPIFF